MLGYGRRSYGFGRESLAEELIELDAIEDLEDGDLGGFIEDEFLLDLI